MNEENLRWEEVRTEHLVQDAWIDFRKTAYRFPDGNVYEPFYTYSRRDYAVIAAVDENGKYLCVRQFRQGTRRITTEFPAGGIEPEDAAAEERSGRTAADADGGGAEEARRFAPLGGPRRVPSLETALETARRELLEETGYESDAWTHLLTIPSCATIADNMAYLFLAENCRRVSGQHLDEMEFLDVHPIGTDEIRGLVDSGEFAQAIHVLALELAEQKRGRD